MTELYYMGRPVEELSKEDLLEALSQCYNLYLKSQETIESISKLSNLEYKPITYLGKIILKGI